VVGKPCFKTATRRAEHAKRKARASGRSVIHRLLSNLGRLFFAGEIALRPSPRMRTSARKRGSSRRALGAAKKVKRTMRRSGCRLVAAGTMFDAVDTLCAAAALTLAGPRAACYRRRSPWSRSSDAPAPRASAAGARPTDHRERGSGGGRPVRRRRPEVIRRGPRARCAGSLPMLLAFMAGSGSRCPLFAPGRCS
jgi:hypothetical protein